MDALLLHETDRFALAATASCRSPSSRDGRVHAALLFYTARS